MFTNMTLQELGQALLKEDADRDAILQEFLRRDQESLSQRATVLKRAQDRQAELVKIYTEINEVKWGIQDEQGLEIQKAVLRERARCLEQEWNREFAELGY